MGCICPQDSRHLVLWIIDKRFKPILESLDDIDSEAINSLKIPREKAQSYDLSYEGLLRLTLIRTYLCGSIEPGYARCSDSVRARGAAELNSHNASIPATKARTCSSTDLISKGTDLLSPQHSNESKSSPGVKNLSGRKRSRGSKHAASGSSKANGIAMYSPALSVYDAAVHHFSYSPGYLGLHSHSLPSSATPQSYPNARIPSSRP